MRVGIFGGTFDPPHIGHLVLAGEALDQVCLDKVYWVLTPDPPHKQGHVISPAAVRADMVKTAIAQFPDFLYSDIEFKRQPPLYSVDTVVLFHQMLPDAQIYYMMGEDSLDDLPTWHEPRSFIQQCDGIIVMERKDEEPDWISLNISLPDLQEKTHILKSPLMEISSHEIRERIKSGRIWRTYVDPAVVAIIEHYKLY